MGQGSSHALGLALGRPDKKVVVFDGDGSLLMNLGSLVTIANQAPKNYVHCLCENGCYETNGSVLTPRSGQIRFAELAKTAGYKKTYEISDLDEWERKAAGDSQRRRAGFRHSQSRARRSIPGKFSAPLQHRVPGKVSSGAGEDLVHEFSRRNFVALRPIINSVRDFCSQRLH